MSDTIANAPNNKLKNIREGEPSQMSDTPQIPNVLPKENYGNSLGMTDTIANSGKNLPSEPSDNSISLKNSI